MIEIYNPKKFVFSGHDTFHCKTLWLKKGYDFIKTGKSFSEESCVELGVGKNMVSGIRHWLKSFGILKDDGNPSEIGDFIFSDSNGVDPYLENEATLYLLHYLLLSTNHASIYPIIFNDFRKLYPEFTLNNLAQFLESREVSVNPTTLKKDFTTFVHNYLSTSKQKTNLEDSFTGVFCDINFLHEVEKGKYSLFNTANLAIPNEVLLYAILTTYENRSINFSSLLKDDNGVGNVFMLNQAALHEKLVEINEEFEEVNYSNNSGIRELQIVGEMNPFDVLNQMYGN